MAIINQVVVREGCRFEAVEVKLYVIRATILRGKRMSQNLTGDRRCWPCTVANAVVGLVVAWLPLVAALVKGETAVVRLAFGWGVAVTAFTLYRLVRRGYLPLAEPVARLTGLHDRIGPDAEPTEPEGKE